jgi:hypothetical protein
MGRGLTSESLVSVWWSLVNKSPIYTYLNMSIILFLCQCSYKEQLLIRTRFIESGFDENPDCVELSAAAQHMETSNKRKRLTFKY